jgi:hypothetical protein
LNPAPRSAISVISEVVFGNLFGCYFQRNGVFRAILPNRLSQTALHTFCIICVPDAIPFFLSTWVKYCFGEQHIRWFLSAVAGVRKLLPSEGYLIAQLRLSKSYYHPKMYST